MFTLFNVSFFYFIVKKLKSPYLKLESTTRQYKVVYQQVDLWPHANVETPRGTCPFDGTSLGGERSREERGDRIGLIPLEPAKTPTTKSKHKESTKTQESSKSSHKYWYIFTLRILLLLNFCLWYLSYSSYIAKKHNWKTNKFFFHYTCTSFS